MYCNYCFVPGARVRCGNHCSNKTALYCNQECANLDWYGHKFACIEGKRDRSELYKYTEDDGEITLIFANGKRLNILKMHAARSNTLRGLMEDTNDAEILLPPAMDYEIFSTLVEPILKGETSWRRLPEIIPNRSALIRLIMHVSYLDISKISLMVPRIGNAHAEKKYHLLEFLFALLSGFLIDRFRTYSYKKDGIYEYPAHVAELSEPVRLPGEFNQQEREVLLEHNDDVAFLGRDIRVLPIMQLAPGEEATLLHLPRDLIRQYILPQMDYLSTLNKFRNRNIRLWHVTTAYMISIAREKFPLLTDFSDEILLQALNDMYGPYQSFTHHRPSLSKNTAKQKYLLSDKELQNIPTTQGRRTQEYSKIALIQAALLKYGSFDGIQEERDKREARRTKMAETRQKNQATKEAIRQANMAILSVLLDEAGIQKYPFQAMLSELQKDFQVWIHGDASEITRDHPIFLRLISYFEHLLKQSYTTYDDLHRWLKTERFLREVHSKVMREDTPP